MTSHDTHRGERGCTAHNGIDNYIQHCLPQHYIQQYRILYDVDKNLIQYLIYRVSRLLGVKGHTVVPVVVRVRGEGVDGGWPGEGVDGGWPGDGG